MAESASFGFIFGCLFPVVSTGIALLSTDTVPSWSKVWGLHASEPLLQVIDAVPVLLMLAFGVVGRSRAELDALVEGLEVRVKQRTSVLDEANRAVEAKGRARGRLMARVSDSMVEQIKSIIDAPRTQRNPWAWESVMDVASRVRNLSRFEAGEVWQEDEVFAPTALAERVRVDVHESRTIATPVEMTLDKNVPESIRANRGLMEAALKIGVQLTAGLAADTPTVVSIRQQRGAPGSPDKLHLECRNAGACDTSSSVSQILENAGDKESTSDAVRDLLGVTLNIYVKALQAELAMKTTERDGTVISILVPVEVVAAAKAEPAPAAASDAKPKADAIDVPTSEETAEAVDEDDDKDDDKADDKADDKDDDKDDDKAEGSAKESA